jgi:hypothetical protein
MNNIDDLNIQLNSLNINDDAYSIIKTNNAIKIQQWWYNINKKHIYYIIKQIKQHLSIGNLQEFINRCHSIKKKCNRDGAGLTGGILTEMIVHEYFEEHIPSYEEYHSHESDCKLYEMQFSIKKITGKSSIALNWSKNNNNIINSYFNCNIMIINLKTEQWWKNKPQKNDSDIKYNSIIPSGIYFIDKHYCKRNISTTSNNKTDTLISNIELYKMIDNSIENKMYIKLPGCDEIYDCKISNCFSKQ